LGQAILVFGIGVGDVGFGFLDLALAKFFLLRSKLLL